MNLSTIATTFGVVLAALLTAAGAIGIWAAFRVGRNAQTIANYRDALQSWKERSETQDVKIAEQEQEISELKDSQHRLEAENADLRGQMSVLRDAISGRQGFDQMIGKIAQQNELLVNRLDLQHKELLERLDKIAGGR